MEKFCTSVKRKYGERLINHVEQWPPCHGEKLIRLELVKRKRGESYALIKVMPHLPHPGEGWGWGGDWTFLNAKARDVGQCSMPNPSPPPPLSVG